MPDSEGMLLEDRLWWLRGRKAIIEEYLERAARHGAVSRIMDIGCGSGGSHDVLGRFGRVIGVERSEVLASRARSRGLAEVVLQQDALTLDECRDVELFTMFDVLEHIESDRLFLAELRKKAAHKHLLLVSVPACPFLYSNHDRVLHHYRRYTDRALRSALDAGGYRVLHMSYFMFFLFPLALLARLREKCMARLGRQSAAIDLGDCPALLSAPLASTLRVEAFLSRRVRFPIGLWLFALAESSDERRPT